MNGEPVLPRWSARLAVAEIPASVLAESMTDSGRVVDGDTLELSGASGSGSGASTSDRRLAGLPAGGQPWRCGDDATAALRRLVDGRKPTCNARSRDHYGRIVAVCRVDSRDIGAELVREGWALDYRHYSGGANAAEQQAAAAERAGLWAGEFVPPWDWRQAKH
jgi:endonuclease YncB( thermonuclease family)